MDILVVGVDSDIGAAIAARHRALGDRVETTSRNGRGTYHLELAHPRMWPALTTDAYDIMYYCIGIGDGRASRMEVVQINAFGAWDYVSNTAPRVVREGGSIVVLSSGWASITAIKSAKSPVYRMSKAALNMGIACLAQHFPTYNWLLVNPGMVNTKMTQNLRISATHERDFIEADVSAAGVVEQSTKNKRQFAFVDYLGNTVPF